MLTKFSLMKTMMRIRHDVMRTLDRCAMADSSLPETHVLTVGIQDPIDVASCRQSVKEMVASLGFSSEEQARMLASVNDITRISVAYKLQGRLSCSITDENFLVRFVVNLSCLAAASLSKSLPDECSVLALQPGECELTVVKSVRIRVFSSQPDDSQIDGQILIA